MKTKVCKVLVRLATMYGLETVALTKTQKVELKYANTNTFPIKLPFYLPIVSFGHVRGGRSPERRMLQMMYMKLPGKRFRGIP